MLQQHIIFLQKKPPKKHKTLLNSGFPLIFRAVGVHGNHTKSNGIKPKTDPAQLLWAQRIQDLRHVKHCVNIGHNCDTFLFGIHSDKRIIIISSHNSSPEKPIQTNFQSKYSARDTKRYNLKEAQTLLLQHFNPSQRVDIVTAC